MARCPTLARAAALWLVCLFLAGPVGAQELALLRQRTNSAIAIPAAQGLDLIYSAEPLGKGRFRLRALNRSHSVVVPELGNGSVYTGYYTFAYGLSNQLDLSLVLPFLLDSAGGFNKYGSGDPVFGVKWARPGTVPAGTYTGFQLLLGLPLGYKGEHALDAIGGIRHFSNEAFDVGMQGLLDFHFRRLSIYLNGGLFRSGNPDVVSQLLYGIGLEGWRSSRRVSANAEYQARIAFAQQSRADNVLKLGVRIQTLRGVELELARELGFLDHPTKALTTVGVRTHGYLSGRRRFESRVALYQPPPPPKRLYEPAKVLRIAIIDFGGFEEYQAGRRLVEKIRTRLEPHDSLEVVDLSGYAGLPRPGVLTPRQSLDLAHKLNVDVIVTGTVSTYEVDRFHGLRVPYVFEVPETEVAVGLRYRVMWFADAAHTDMQAFTEEIVGKGMLRKRVRLLPADRRDITVACSALDLAHLHDAALDNLAGSMLASMARTFSWIPPDFAYAQF